MGHRRGHQVVFVKRDSPGHAGPALSLPGTFVEKKYIPNTPLRPQTPLFATKHSFSPQTPLLIHQTQLLTHQTPFHPIANTSFPPETPHYVVDTPLRPPKLLSTTKHLKAPHFRPKHPRYPPPLFTPNTPVCPKAPHLHPKHSIIPSTPLFTPNTSFRHQTPFFATKHPICTANAHWWVKRGVWGEKGCFVAKSGVWERKGVFGIYIFFNKSPWEEQSRSRVSWRVPFDKYN